MKATDGEDGKPMKRHGKAGSDLVVEVPIGTVLRDVDGKAVAEIGATDELFRLLRGGRGGRGNAHFATSSQQAPRRSEEGEAGSEVSLYLEVRRLADIGLVGFPNAGKSTFLNKITNARSKAAGYAFTTLSPVLGFYDLGLGRGIVVADLPGIVRGAHVGRGLGLDFLDQIDRSPFLLYLIDASSASPGEDFAALKGELHRYRAALLERPYAIGISKCDLVKERESVVGLFPKEEQPKILFLSSVAGLGLEAFRELAGAVYDSKSAQASEKVEGWDG